MSIIVNFVGEARKEDLSTVYHTSQDYEEMVKLVQELDELLNQLRQMAD
ncbi:aspartyl-phosphate phosphatase Spo0E family protein [Halobacillus andaensis]|nr:aspartyl-phosphate phosphatase Spo0E family protein [Halobacillus andaensis]MBP2004292.1 hypothetical protein [Halobacillus andaensis]